MGTNTLDLGSLEKAFKQLKKSVKYLRSEEAAKDQALYEQFRASVIKSFEYNFELSYKMIKRRLEKMVPNPAEIDQMDYKGIIRSAAEAGLIKDPKSFFNYREKRNITAHTYNADKAEEIISIIDVFADDIELLLKSLARNNF